MKGEKQLENLTCSVDYINKKFNEYKEERKRKDKQIKCFTRACKTHESKYNTRAIKIEQQTDRQVQYSRSNCLLTHGIEERRQKVTEELVIQTTKSEMNIDINLEILTGLIEQVQKEKANVIPKLYILQGIQKDTKFSIAKGD